MDYPLAFLREVDGIVKDEILKGFIDAIFENTIDVETIPNEKLKQNWIRLLMEADTAAARMEANLEKVGLAAVKDIKKTKKKTAKDRAKDAGLIVLEPNVPNPGKLIID